MDVLVDYGAVTPAWVQTRSAELVAEGEAIVAGIEALDDDQLTFDSTLGALDRLADVLGRLLGQVGFLGFCHPDAPVREAAMEVVRRRSEFEIAMWERPRVADRIAAYAATAEAGALAGDQARLLMSAQRSRRLGGHELPAQDKLELSRLRHRLVALETEFTSNLTAVTDHLDVPACELTGMPQSYLDSLGPGDAQGTLRVTTAYPHVVPLYTSCSNRSLRYAVRVMDQSKAVAANRPLLLEAAAVRFAIAKLFGEESWAALRLEPRMAGSPQRVAEFYSDLLPRLTPAGLRERAALQLLLDADRAAGSAGDDPVLGDHDWRYYDTVQRERMFGLDPWVIAEYFPFEAVLDGLLDLTSQMFGVTYVRAEASTWHPSVLSLSVVDDDSGDVIAHVYMDLHPREGKYRHAAAFEIVAGRELPDGSYQPPVTAIVANFTAPTADTPALLQHSEVVTFFHEFGHVLHMSLTRARYTSQAGATVQQDFVEAPSQILEHWAWNPQVLAGFARHHRTGTPLPEDMLASMVAARDLNEGLRTLRQVALGEFDQWMDGPEQPFDLDAALVETWRIGLFDPLPGTCYAASFGHLMHEYDAGYYGYLWSEVYGDDMFSEFERVGVTNPEVGRRYRDRVLAVGGSIDGLDLLRGFLGRDPRPDAFLARRGLTST